MDKQAFNAADSVTRYYILLVIVVTWHGTIGTHETRSRRVLARMAIGIEKSLVNAVRLIVQRSQLCYDSYGLNKGV